MSVEAASLKLSAHVLVQLGSELVTDVEQAILECVKNAYDADSSDCRIEIDTRETGVLEEFGTFGTIGRFATTAESVKVEVSEKDGKPIKPGVHQVGMPVRRTLRYTGRISIVDKGSGLTTDQLNSSWLVISQSVKRNTPGARKNPTPGGRTPLGDKGLGRLGTMKLGDILLIETATSPSERISRAHFRWADCQTAATIDEIPVRLATADNTSGFKGTRVSILGLNEMPEWRRDNRIDEITRSLAKLISPFEATSTFPVTVHLDGNSRSLVAVTNDLMARAVAEFKFRWERNPESGNANLVAVAKFRKRLFTSARSSKQEERTKLVFGKDGGAGFAEALPRYGRMKAYPTKVTDGAAWYIEMTRVFPWTSFQFENQATMQDPGPFEAAFYFFHLDEKSGVDTSSAAGLAVDKKLIKSVAGIAILRDGFRVRSQGDWLGIAAGMTSGSTYGMRVDNTLGYFALSGDRNFGLTEKSDREGFVEDAAYRGFFQIASRCRDFANDSMEAVRRSLDEYAKNIDDTDPAAVVDVNPLSAVERNLRTAEDARTLADRTVRELQRGIEALSHGTGGSTGIDSTRAQAMKLASDAVLAIEGVRRTLDEAPPAELTLRRMKRKVDDGEVQAAALFESAAVGLSARGLAHELRTHLSEIRRRATAIQNLSKSNAGEGAILPHLRAIRGSCSSISSAASQIDPMLPRSRALRDTFTIIDFVSDYVENRTLTFEQAGVKFVFGPRTAKTTVKVNRPRLLQVVDNLVRNSLYWLRADKASGQAVGRKEIHLDVTDEGFVLSDTGPGVDEAIEDAIFEIFVSGKPERDTGQGLGLFIIKQLLALDGCDITLLQDRNERNRRYKFDVNLASIITRV